MAAATPRALLERAEALRRAGKPREAGALLDALLGTELRADALHMMAAMALSTGRPAAALELVQRAIAARPDFAIAHNTLGVVLKDVDRPDDAIAAFRRALALRPDFAEALNGLGNVLQGRGREDEAEAAYRRAIALKPGLAEPYCNLGFLRLDQGRAAEAEPWCRQAIDVDPFHAEAHNNLAISLLLQGKLAEGFREREWRWRTKGLRAAWPSFAQPTWDGGALEGRRILLWQEQGFGDSIQFARYLPLVRARGGEAILRVKPPLLRLLRPLADRAVAADEAPPEFDCHAPLMSLPHLFRTDESTIPAATPYLAAPPDAPPFALGPGPRIGLAWAGNPDHRHDRRRSLSLAALAPLLAAPTARFFGLQVGPRAAEAAGFPLVDLSPRLGDFADTAAAIAALDLVISVDTAVAHLAGALGRPCWLLLHSAPDWRWLLAGERSAWYPSLRLFRQPAPGAWAPVIERAAAALRAWIARPGTSPIG